MLNNKSSRIRLFVKVPWGSAANSNAEKMLNELSIEYNKTRQFAITQELIEVVSGANAQN